MPYTRVRKHMRQGRPVRAHTRRLPARTAEAGAGIAVLFAIAVLGWVFANGSDGSPSPGSSTWKLGGLTYTRIQAASASDCATHAYDRVAEHLREHPCTTQRRMLLTATDGHARRAVVTIAWVTMPSARKAERLKKLMDTHGTGNITSLASDHPIYDQVRFTGNHYDSRQSGKTVIIAEAEPHPGSSPPPWLDKAATTALNHPG